MADRFLALRMFGAFAWPPIPGSLQNGTVEGAVEIYFVRKGEAQPYAACLRWVPKEKFPPEQQENPADVAWLNFTGKYDTILDLYAILTDEDLRKAVGDGSEVFSFRFAEPHDNNNPVLKFDGGRVYEQFDTPSSLGDGAHASAGDLPLHLRVPLVRHRLDAPDKILSGIEIGRSNSKKTAGNLRVELALPTPLPLGQDGFVDSEGGILAFAAVCSGRHLILIDPTKPSKVDAATAAASGGTAGDKVLFDTLLMGVPDQSQGFKTSHDFRVGEILFGRSNSPTARLSGPYGSNQEKDRWLQSGAVATVLGRLGLQASGDVTQQLDLESAATGGLLPTSAGLWLGDVSRADGIPGFRVLNRLQLTGTGNAGGDNDDIHVKGGNIWLRRRRGNDDWIVVGKILHILADASGSVRHQDVWKADHTLTVELKLAWSETLLKKGKDAPAGSFAETLAHADVRMKTARTSLGAIEGAQPGSLFATVDWSADQLIAVSYGPVRSGQAAIKNGVSKLDLESLKLDGPASLRGSILDARDIPADAKDKAPGQGTAARKAATIQLTFPLFERPQDGSGKKLTEFKVRLVRDPAVDDPESDLPAMTLAVQLAAPDGKTALASLASDVSSSQPPVSPQAETAQPPFAPVVKGLPPAAAPQPEKTFAALASIGGLAFGKVGLDGKAEGKELYSFLRIVPAATGAGEPDLHFRICAAAERVIPIGIDRARGHRRHRRDPVMLDEADTRSITGRYPLIATEYLSARDDRRLTVQLRDAVDDAGQTGSFILLSQAPFSIKRVISEPLATRGDETTLAVAEYDSDTRQWLTRAVSRAYRYVLPPQSIGESMDKPRRLELHDLEQDQTLPQHGDLTNPVKRYAVEFRLTPPAQLWVRPTDVARRFVLPEWAAADIFTQRGELGLGASLAGLRAEFVYGLAIGIDPAREQGPARRAGVAEIEALVGRPTPAGETNGGEAEALALKPGTLARRRAALLEAYETRPERLEIWADDPDHPLQFAPAYFSAGASFALRHTALHRHPVADPPPPSDGLPPVVQDGPIQPRFHPQGLSGGALWPIESRNVLAMVAANPQASGGSIERIALSPLGGDADQTARFANNRAAIITETRGGYVQRQKVEVIGRIAVLWHRAKHVIVYERTVNPSAQFAPLDAENAKTRTRRPVLRKVREYIEVLQPERRYPDVGTAPASSCSFLAGVRFNCRIIPVDSEWAEDVKDGFLVPLWNGHAARQRPQVYPRPDVAFLSHAEGATDAPEAAQECLNPENLYFFADTSDGVTDDTDAWPQRLGIDASSMPPPCHNWPHKDGDVPEPPEAGADVVKESERRVPRGFARFTWRVAPPTARTAINAGRADKAVYAALETVTFARSVGEVDDRIDTAAKFKMDWGVDADNLAIKGVWERGETIGGEKNLVAISTGLKSVFDVLPSHLPESSDDKNKITAAIIGLARTLLPDNSGENKIGEVLAVLSNRKGSVEDNISEALRNAGLNELPKACDSLTADLTAKINARKLALRQELRAWEAEALRDLDQAGEKADEILAAFNKEKLSDYLNKQLTDFIRPAMNSATAEIGKLQRGIETARATVADVLAEAEASLDRLRADLTAARRAIEDNKPWSQARLDRFEQQLDTAFAKAGERLVAIVADAEHRLATELDDMSQKVAGAAAQALSLVADLKGDLDAGQGLLAEWIGELKKLPPYLEGPKLEEKLKKAKQAVANAEKAKNDKLKAAAAKARVLVEKIDRARDNFAKDLAGMIARVERLELEIGKDVATQLETAAGCVTAAGADIQQVSDLLKGVTDDEGESLKDELLETLGALKADFGDATAPACRRFAKFGRWADAVIDTQFETIERVQARLRDAVAVVSAHVDKVAANLLAEVEDARKALEPDTLAKTIVGALLGLGPVSQAMAQAVAIVDEAGTDITRKRDAARRALTSLVDTLDTELDNVAGAVVGKLDVVTGVCGKLAKGVADSIDDIAKKIVDDAGLNLIAKKFNNLKDGLEDALNDAEKYGEFVKAFSDFDDDMRAIGNDLAASVKRAEAWGDRALDAIGDIGKGNLASAPNNILKALAAVGSGPELPNLDFARERIGYYYGLAQNVVDTTPVEAWFGKLGDSLKAMGISLPFRSIGDCLQADDLRNFDIGRIFSCFCGFDLSNLFKNVKLPKGAGDGIKVTPGFDEDAYRAWVQIDVTVDIPGRSPAVAIGPFNLDFVDSKFIGFLRFEASKDTETVEQFGRATIRADIEPVIAGQNIVTLREVEIRYAKTSGLKVDFDPKKIKPNPVFEFIQNAFRSIFGDQVGGFDIVKQNGVPVGLRHLFATPPLSLMFGASGVQNIAISNQFELLAYPDFVIANRFSLARPERPFIFTIFIIGGTGYLTANFEYRPFQGNGELLVVVEAGAGGAAALGFAFAGVTGSVSITISVVLSYRKLIGQAGGGLTVSLLVVINGMVDVLHIVSASITVMLRLSYRDNGDIDALGSFRITIRISRFFKISAGGEARYRMSGGQRQVSSSSSVEHEITDKNLKKAAKLLGQES